VTTLGPQCANQTAGINEGDKSRFPWHGSRDTRLSSHQTKQGVVACWGSQPYRGPGRDKHLRSALSVAQNSHKDDLSLVQDSARKFIGLGLILGFNRAAS
jgi:hypothetical protein